VTPSSQTVTGGQAVVKALHAEGVDVIFGIPGAHVGPIYDALLEEPGIRRILARHEQGVAFMADGYARATGRPGVAIVTGGPGLTNAATAISEAYVDSSPILVISSQVSARYIGLERGNLHEMKDQDGLMQSIAGWHVRANRVSDIPKLIHQAMQRFQTIRPRPIHIEIPIDLLRATADVAFPSRETFARPDEDPKAIAQAVELLRAAERPLIYAGGGVAASGAERELLRLAQALDAPVITSIMGKGAIPEDHPLALGSSRRVSGAMRALVEASDLVLVVGSKLGAMATDDWRLPLPANVIHIDIDPAVIGQTYPARLGIIGDAKQVLQELLKQMQDWPPRGGRGGMVAEAVQQRLTQLWTKTPMQMRLIQDIRQALPREAIICWDMTILGYASTNYFPIYQTRSYLYPFTSGTLGFGLPVAIGAKVGQPDAPVISISGDGGFLFTGEELPCAVQHQLNTVHIVFNDHCYTAVKNIHQNEFDGRSVDVDLAPVDYVKLAEAYGARGLRVEPEQLGETLKRALTLEVPTLIEVPVSFNPAW
jgi:acetolactate synthase-1/2/3 large subunit